MKRLTRKQKEEIDWLSQERESLRPAFVPTDEEIEDYIAMTVHGTKKSEGNRERNRLFVAKRGLDMAVKMWLQDWPLGIMSKEEMLADDPHPFWQRLIGNLNVPKVVDAIPPWEIKAVEDAFVRAVKG